jgi:hypothetical protein
MSKLNLYGQLMFFLMFRPSSPALAKSPLRSKAKALILSEWALIVLFTVQVVVFHIFIEVKLELTKSPLLSTVMAVTALV